MVGWKLQLSPVRQVGCALKGRSSFVNLELEAARGAGLGASRTALCPPLQAGELWQHLLLQQRAPDTVLLQAVPRAGAGLRVAPAAQQARAACEGERADLPSGAVRPGATSASLLTAVPGTALCTLGFCPSAAPLCSAALAALGVLGALGVEILIRCALLLV